MILLTRCLGLILRKLLARTLEYLAKMTLILVWDGKMCFTRRAEKVRFACWVTLRWQVKPTRFT
jgi:hypothetical protein